ncbi:hypothetical protein [Sphingosinicella humi]|uniref:Uncharacterized protein n=1 Tax=Allosphingosinicella humi TaxID=2068657 RepID=A0A2U2J409_9SPHN|nr:hypothetical protein [Sphingosinicella humi]PWG03058.1 hypothetical protein DF286_09385 [Sphingosinicella humi]
MSLADLPPVLEMIIWGAIATAAMTGLMQGAQGLGLSRLSIPFMVGAIFSGDRRVATVVGFAVYFIGGWIFAFVYFLILASLDLLNWWAGGLVGLLHGLLLLVAALPLFPLIHPRMTSDFDAPVARPVLEPPGFLGLHYGGGTPATMLLAQGVYGVLIGGLHQVSRLL